MIKDLLMHHPYAIRDEEEEGVGKTIKALTKSLTLEKGETSPICDLYSHMYGLVDQMNRAFYSQIDPAGHRTWRKLYLIVLLFMIARNGWSFYLERQHLHRATAEGGNKMKGEDVRRYTLSTFIITFCKQVPRK